MGGIQTFSRFLVRGLRQSFPEATICVLSKNDTSYPDSGNDWTTTFTALGWWPERLRTAAFAAELFRRAMRERPDLIITTHVNFAPVALTLKKISGIPFVAVGHGVDVWQISKSSVTKALRAATPLLSVSEFTQSQMAAGLGIPPDSIEILPNTFDPERFAPGAKPRFLLKRYGLTPEQPVILTIGRLASEDRYKGYDQVIRALPAIREQFPNVRYILGGRGPDRPRIEALIDELEVRENVILAGYVPDHELREHYNLCDVFAMPSKGEGFGIVFLEAIGCGKPVLAGNKDGSVDAVLGGRIGALVDPDDLQEITATLIQLLSGTHPNAILSNSQELRRRVIEAYGYERFVERLREILAPFAEARSGK